MTTPTTAEQMVSSDTIDAYHMRIKLAYDLYVADCDDHDQAMLRASVAAATFAMSSADAARYARRQLPQSGGYVCDDDGIIPADTVRTIAETDYNHEQAMNAIASLLQSHEALRTRADTSERERVAAINEMATARRTAMENKDDAMLLRTLLSLDYERGGSGLLLGVHARARAAETALQTERERADAAERRVEALTSDAAVDAAAKSLCETLHADPELKDDGRTPLFQPWRKLDYAARKDWRVHAREMLNSALAAASGAADGAATREG